MQLQPVYDGPPVIAVEGFDDLTVPLLRQRRRLLATLASLSDEQWATQSRCDEWTVQGVVTHLISTDQFWGVSIAAGLRGEPTRFLATFDPVASPAELVRRDATLTPAEVLARFEAAVAGFGAVLASIAADQWRTVVAEAPPGHLQLNAVVMHALWDGWIHERDIAIPLGLPLVEEADEVEAILRYAVGLSPAMSASLNSGHTGTLAIEATDPSLSLLVSATPLVHVGDGTADAGPRLTGKSVDLIEGLSYRADLPHDLSDEDRWLLLGLAEIFDQG